MTLIELDKLLDHEPVLTDAQREQLQHGMIPTVFMGPEDLFNLGWRTAISHTRKKLGLSPHSLETKL